eukprot:6264-Eustigmatos_ZCMA.PRE.1
MRERGERAGAHVASARVSHPGRRVPGRLDRPVEVCRREGQGRVHLPLLQRQGQELREQARRAEAHDGQRPLQAE